MRFPFLTAAPLGCLTLLLFLGGCTVGPDYQRPAAPPATEFKELAGWKPATPQAPAGTDWWSVYDDTLLNDLEAQVALSNQNIKVSEAAYRQALAITEEARASYFPTLSADFGATRSRSASGQTSTTQIGGTSVSSSSFGGPRNDFTLGGTLSWVPDIWGKISRTVESDQASASASADDLAAATVSYQATLATDYFNLRQLDEQGVLLDQTIAAYRRSADIARNQYAAGTAAKTDVITAETQLSGAEAQRVGLGVSRAAYEHAIAVLIGKAPADLTIKPDRLATHVPVVPAGIPSELLERRPDIAAAERQMEAANASVGVAIAAYYPDITLSATGSLASTAIDTLTRASNGAWSLGSSATEEIFDGGLRSAQVDAARAAFDSSVATYRQTVLTDFQQVEDALAALRVLQAEADVQTRTVALANQAVDLTLNQYKAGTVSYTNVVTAQTIALSDAESLLTIRASELTNSVSLIVALGGGWAGETKLAAGN